MYLIIPRRLLINEQNDSDDLNQSYSDDSEIIVKKSLQKKINRAIGNFKQMGCFKWIIS